MLNYKPLQPKTQAKTITPVAGDNSKEKVTLWEGERPHGRASQLLNAESIVVIERNYQGFSMNFVQLGDMA